MIEEISTIYFQEQIETDGHNPYKFLCSDGNSYIVKYRKSFNKEELELLAYEVVLHELFTFFNVDSPKIAIVKIDKGSFDPKKLKYSRYLRDSPRAFGSKVIDGAIDVTSLETIKTKWDYKRFSKIKSLVMIAILDIWVDNIDRKEDNYNLMKVSDENKKQYIVPIDNAFSFGGIHSIGLFKPTDKPYRYNKLISSSYFKSLVQYVEMDERLRVLEQFVNLCNNDCQKTIERLFKLIPKEWLRSKNLLDRINHFLFNKIRNQQVIELVERELTVIPFKA